MYKCDHKYFYLALSFIKVKVEGLCSVRVDVVFNCQKVDMVFNCPKVDLVFNCQKVDLVCQKDNLVSRPKVDLVVRLILDRSMR